MSATDAVRQEGMQTADDNLEQVVSGQTENVQRFIFEDVNTADDAHLVIVSTATNGNLITAKNITTRARTSKWLGRMSDESLQALSHDKRLVRLHLWILLLTSNWRNQM